MILNDLDRTAVNITMICAAKLDDNLLTVNFGAGWWMTLKYSTIDGAYADWHRITDIMDDKEYERKY